MKQLTSLAGLLLALAVLDGLSLLEVSSASITVMFQKTQVTGATCDAQVTDKAGLANRFECAVACAPVVTCKSFIFSDDNCRMTNSSSCSAVSSPEIYIKQ